MINSIDFNGKMCFIY